MQAKGIIWDVGGTLLIRQVLQEELLRQALQETGLQPAALGVGRMAQIQQELGWGQRSWRTLDEEKAGFRAAAEAVLGEGASPAGVERLGDRLANYHDAFQPTPGIQAVLDELQERGIPMAVVSQWPPSLRTCLAHHGMLRYFPVVVVTAEEGVLKPDPRLIHRALDQMALRPAEVVYIGDDLEKDIKAAQAEGLQTIHFGPHRRHPAECYAAEALRSRLEGFFPCLQS